MPIGDALKSIQCGDADVMITGGTEAALTPMGLSGFQNMKALSFRNEDPAGASRPFDLDRDGFVLSEGAGMLVLEELEHARARARTFTAKFWVLVAAVTRDISRNRTSTARVPPRPCQLALRTPELSADRVDYINAHGTSTPLGRQGRDAGRSNASSRTTPTK